MSLIAYFHIVPAQAMPSLMEAATPRKEGWLEGKKDNFYPTLEKAGRIILPQLPWTGDAFLALAGYLKEAHGIDLDELKKNDLSPRLAQLKIEGFLFGPEDAQRLRNRLASIAPTGVELEAFSQKFNGREHTITAEEMQAYFDALNRFLPQIRPGDIGLLTLT